MKSLDGDLLEHSFLRYLKKIKHLNSYFGMNGTNQGNANNFNRLYCKNY